MELTIVFVPSGENPTQLRVTRFSGAGVSSTPVAETLLLNTVDMEVHSVALSDTLAAFCGVKCHPSDGLYVLVVDLQSCRRAIIDVNLTVTVSYDPHFVAVASPDVPLTRFLCTAVWQDISTMGSCCSVIWSPKVL